MPEGLRVRLHLCYNILGHCVDRIRGKDFRLHSINILSVLFAELLWRYSQVFTHILAEETGIGEVKFVCHLLNWSICIYKRMLNLLKAHVIYQPESCLAATLLADCRQVLGRDSQLVGVP